MFLNPCDVFCLDLWSVNQNAEFDRNFLVEVDHHWNWKRLFIYLFKILGRDDDLENSRIHEIEEEGLGGKCWMKFSFGFWGAWVPLFLCDVFLRISCCERVSFGSFIELRMRSREVKVCLRCKTRVRRFSVYICFWLTTLNFNLDIPHGSMLPGLPRCYNQHQTCGTSPKWSGQFGTDYPQSVSRCERCSVYVIFTSTLGPPRQSNIAPWFSLWLD